MPNDRFRLSRRDFCGATASWLVASGLPTSFADDVNADVALRSSGRTRKEVPAWIRRVTVMAFGSEGDLDDMADAGVEVLHTNLVWPYFPLHANDGGLSKEDATKLTQLVEACHRRQIRLSLGLPPFPPASLVREHPEWRVHSDPAGSNLSTEPSDSDLGTRIGCNLGPWGNYLIAVCAELVADFGIDGVSFDGNYHPGVCHCPACRTAYQTERKRSIPATVNLDDLAYREYLVWRGEKLELHYRALRERLRHANPDAAVMTWTVNAGRYGHLIHSPRAMPTHMNREIDLPMQEWWLDETNLGSSMAPAFGAMYLTAVAGGPAASEPYLMSRGNPYGTHSFPAHERLARTLLAVTYGNVTAQSFGWPGHRESAKECCREVRRRSKWLTDVSPLRWAAMLVSEQTRQFYAYRDIAERFLPHVFGGFRAAVEEHLPLSLINDWDLTEERLAGQRVLVLANAAALSDEQVAAVRRFVEQGGGLVATCETSLCNELGEPRGDFALADLFGVSFRGRPGATPNVEALDENFAKHLDENYWKERVGVANLSWSDHELTRDETLQRLVPTSNVLFRGPQLLVSEPVVASEVAIRMTPDGSTAPPVPAAIVRAFGQGRVVYFPAAIEAALWSYAFPYQRRLFAQAIRWAAGSKPPIEVAAPMCVHVRAYSQSAADKNRLIVHLFNDLSSNAGHGLPSAEVPLREESIPIAGIRISFHDKRPTRCRLEPEGIELPVSESDGPWSIAVPALERHAIVVAEL